MQENYGRPPSGWIYPESVVTDNNFLSDTKERKGGNNDYNNYNSNSHNLDKQKKI